LDSYYLQSYCLLFTFFIVLSFLTISSYVGYLVNDVHNNIIKEIIYKTVNSRWWVKQAERTMWSKCSCKYI